MANNHKPPQPQRRYTFEDVWAALMEGRKQQEETAKRMKETDRQIKELSKQMGGLHNSFGELAEHLVAPGIAERFNKLGYHFDDISCGRRQILDENRKVKAEIDILLENGDFIIAVEVKSEPKEKDIERHIKRLGILREHRNKHRDTRKILGAIAGAIFPHEVKELALEAGFYVLEQSGDTMKMDIPDDFIPGEW
ncbi:MAG: hypothetical protein FWC36_00695 [Spirochaetes bacterium]|nr:hypothetical protein [Spirochaetota bacterium]